MTATGRIRVWAARLVALTPQQALWLELMPFYSRQAWLHDERNLKEWLDLFADDGEVEAKTVFLVYRSHLETDHQLLSGCRGDALRKVHGARRYRGAR